MLAKIGYRAFTTVTGPEACEKSAEPAEIRIEPAQVHMSVGDRLHYDDLVIEAYDEAGKFLPELPITVQVLAGDGLLQGRSDWQYLEAVSPGTGALRVNWLCNGDHHAFAAIMVADQ